MYLDGGNRSPFLRASRDINYVKEHGRRVSTPLFNMLVCKTVEQGSRVGIVVGGRFGMAVRRNRAKRLFRELTRQVRHDLVPGYDILVFPKRDALGITFADLRDAWLAALSRQGVLRAH